MALTYETFALVAFVLLSACLLAFFVYLFKNRRIYLIEIAQEFRVTTFTVDCDTWERITALIKEHEPELLKSIDPRSFS